MPGGIETMQVLRTIAAVRAALRTARAPEGKLVGLVPTMGALHRGHLSLVERARGECGVVAASIFVNPLQFGPNEDFDRYPRQLERDCELFEATGVDVVFAPGVMEMVPAGATTTVDVGAIGTKLDGAHRPGHFLGVATIVAKLFHVIQPDRAYFGQKDAVQVAVLRQMVRDLNFPVELVACPIVRDEDGLALSSRNAYLSAEERARALTIPRALEAMREEVAAGIVDADFVLKAGVDVIQRLGGIELEYLQVVDAKTLEPVQVIRPGTLIAMAARVGKTRLIDNFLV
jgi:pantoate--beta-alanine ligase